MAGMECTIKRENHLIILNVWKGRVITIIISVLLEAVFSQTVRYIGKATVALILKV
jgi:hypothetical protein